MKGAQKMQLKTMIYSLSLLAAPATLFSCGKKSETKTECSEGGKVSDVCFKNLSSSGLSFNNASISGTGSALAVSPLADSVDGGKNIELTFSLNDGGSLILKAFSKTDLSGGVDIHLKRDASKLEIKFGESQEKELAIDAAGEMKLLLDVHNDEDPAHIVIWNGAGVFSKEDSILNSEDDGAIKPSGKGGDKFWGVTLTNATLSSAVVSDPKDEE